MVRVLLDRGATANSEDDLGRTPLHLVAKGSSDIGHDGVGVTQLLLEHGADINARDHHNTTPLHLASHYSKDEILRVLLDRGANVSAKDAQSRTPLHIVSQRVYTYSSAGADVDVARLLLAHGADVNARNSNHKTPLTLARRHNRSDIAWLLLDHGGKSGTEIDQSPTPNQLGSEDVYPYDEVAPST